MRKALLPLLLITAMALIVSVAMASDYSTTGPIGSDASWTTSGNWQGNSPMAGTGDAYASHPVTTGPSGAFSLDVSFTIGNAANQMGAGILDANGNSIKLSYANGNVLLNGNIFGQVSAGASTTYHARISSQGGSQCHVEICGVSGDVAFAGAPTGTFVELLTVKGTAPAITSVSFVSSDAVVTPVPTAEPVSTGIAYDVQKVREFYAKEDNIYSPYDIITYNPDGTYTVTPGYPTADGTTAAAPATCIVAGTVTAAADGKPVEGASVVLGDAIEKTDSLGKFQFDGVSKGSYDIAVSADGFASKTQAVAVSADQDLAFALDPASAGGSAVASAANETGNMTVAANTTAPAVVTANNTTPVPTQTRAPGFEAILSALAIIAIAGLVLYARRK